MISVVSEVCPRCSAVGALRVQDTYTSGETGPSHTALERFDCPNACKVELEELLEVFPSYVR